MMSLVIINESVNDRTICPAIQGFVRSIPNSDRTLSVDRPLFAALFGTAVARRLEQALVHYVVHYSEYCHEIHLFSIN